MKSYLRDKPKVMSDINIVPFTDVVLVLLVIFMVTTPFLFQGAFQVNLPKVAAPSPNIPESITLTVTTTGAVLLNGTEIPLEALTIRLRAILKEKPSVPVMINADRNVSHGTVMGVMSGAYEAGVSRLGIAVEQNSSSDGDKE